MILFYDKKDKKSLSFIERLLHHNYYPLSVVCSLMLWLKGALERGSLLSVLISSRVRSDTPGSTKGAKRLPTCRTCEKSSQQAKRA